MINFIYITVSTIFVTLQLAKEYIQIQTDIAMMLQRK